MKKLAFLLSLLALSARAGIVPGLEAYGDLTLVDEVNCVTDTTHGFAEYPAGRSYVTNILGSNCRVMHHVSKSETSNGNESGAYVCWRIGRGKGIVPNDPYILVVDYPDEAPRSVGVINYGIGARHGYHTGFTVGDSMSPPYVTQSLESWAIPFSGEYKQLVEVMFPFEKSQRRELATKNGSVRIDMATEGFDLAFTLLPQEDATDSVGLALRAIRLYHVSDYAAAKPEIHYPAGDVPRRVVTSREEMGDGDGLDSYSTPADFYVGKARLMSMLGMNATSRDLLEFGYQQYLGNHGKWSSAANYWDATLDHMAEEGHYILPIYEYSGSRGPGGLGINDAYRPWTLDSAANEANKYLFSNQSYVYNSLADVTLPETLADFQDLLDISIVQKKSRANFLGAIIRSRGQMPIGFGPRTIALFNEETGRTAAGTAVTRADIYNNGSYETTALYQEYRAWWYLKRRDFFEGAKQYLKENGLPGAKLFYDSCMAEPGEFWGVKGNRMNGWQNPIHVRESTDADKTFCGKTWRQLSGKSGVVNQTPYMNQRYWAEALDTDFPTWGSYEINHSCPADDYDNYADRTDLALCYPFSCVYHVLLGTTSEKYRNSTDDLFLMRHYSLNENNLHDENGVAEPGFCGYYTMDFDHAGRAVMISELWAMAMNDPTMIGYLFGSNLDRLDAPYVREFNLNFLSLPATKSTVLSGGYWGSDRTVRRWTTAAGNYWAVINLSTEPYEGDFNLQTSKGRVYRTVDWSAETVSSGSVHLSMEPLQMIAFTDIAPDGPVVGVECTGVDGLSATVSVTVSALPGGTGTLTLERATSADFSGAVVADTRTVNAIGSYQVPLAGLEPNTPYYVRATLVCGSDSTQATTGFTSGVPATFPSGTMSVSATSNGATLSVDLASLGEGSTSCDLYAVFTPSAPGLAVRSGLLGSRSAAGPCSFSFTPLSSEATYTVELFATNSAGYGASLGATTTTTLPRPAGDPSAPEYRPGLMQHKYGCTQSQHPDWSVGAYGQADADRTLGTIMADVTGNPGPTVANPLSGKAYKWANNTTFVYEGQMWFEGGVAYNFFHNVDDGVAIELDGTMFTDLGNSSGYQTITQVSKTYAESGWHDIRVWVYDWSGGKGYGGKVGNLGYTTGLGWNTNGTTSVTAADVDKWSNLSDPGDGSLLRTRIGCGYVAAAGVPARSGSALLVPLRYRSYDEDDALVVYYRPSAIPADPFDPTAWQGSADVAPLAFPGETTATATVPGLSLQPGDTVWLIARLSNARLGHESWSEPVSYTVPADLSDPEFTAALDGAAGFRDAAFSVAVASVGDGAQNVTVTLAVTGGGATRNYTLAQDAASYAGTFRTPYELAYDTDYTAVVTVRNNLGRTATKTIAFRTLPPVPVAGSVAADPVGYTNATIAATIAELGTDATRADVVFQIATDAAFAHVVRTSAGLFATASGQTVSFTADGLADNTDYWARAQLSSDNGTSSTTEAVSFRTRRFTAPVFADGAAVVAGSSNAAALTVSLGALGDGSETVALAWTLAGGPADATSGTVVVAAAATPASIPFAGLAPETTYTVTLVATGANGLSAQLPPISFTTPALAVALAAPRVDLAADGANVAASVEVLRADAGAALYAILDGGAPETVAANALAGTTYDFAFPVGTGAVRTVRFRLVGGAGDVVQTPVVPVRGHKRADWFTVALGEGYEAWPFSGSTGPDGGSWTLEGTPAALVSAGGAVRVSLAGGEGDRVVYAPAPFDPTKADGSIRVSGRARMFAGGAGVPEPAGAPVAGLSMRDAGGNEAVFVGWTANGWTDLVGVAAESGTDVDWTADLDFEAGTVVYRVGGLVLSDRTGTAALPAPAKASRTVDSVAFVGAGEIGDFRGWYFAADGTLVVVAPVLFGLDDDDVVGEGRPLPLSFDVNGQNVPVMRLAISLAHVEPGTHLAAFESGDLGAPDDEWVCVGGSFEVTASQKSAGYLPIELDGSAPAKFVKLVASTDPISANTTLADLGE